MEKLEICHLGFDTCSYVHKIAYLGQESSVYRYGGCRQNVAFSR